MKQQQYKVGIYVRLSKEDSRAGESLSIENQKLILQKHVAEQPTWTLEKIYVDDDYGGTNFDRPGVKQLIADVENGKINLVLCKDLSRFGRNYIQVGQYVDYVFPLHNTRFVALSDGVDTIDKDSANLDMMPMLNIFNEWHSKQTSKKIRTVIEANAKAGKYRANKAPYGYVKGDCEKRLPIIDPPAAVNVRRMFEMRAQGMSAKHIADVFNGEGILIPSDYEAQRTGKPPTHKSNHFWCKDNIKRMLNNPIYLGDLVQLRTQKVSYKTKKIVNRNEEDMVIHRDTHEAIISRELWAKVREMEASVAIGKRNKQGITLPLSGLMECLDCGYKMKAGVNNTTNGSKKNPRIYYRQNYNCGNYIRSGKFACTSHYINLKDIHQIVVDDIRTKANLCWKVKLPLENCSCKIRRMLRTSKLKSVVLNLRNPKNGLRNLTD
jgi:DNA invertase Pin-like site-specific DNA recombinase